MVDPALEGNWSTMLVQAQRFAALGNFDEALARLRWLQRSLQEALQQSLGSELRSRVEVLLQQAVDNHAAWEQSASAQRQSLAELRQAAVRNVAPNKS